MKGGRVGGGFTARAGGEGGGGRYGGTWRRVVGGRGPDGEAEGARGVQGPDRPGGTRWGAGGRGVGGAAPGRAGVPGADDGEVEAELRPRCRNRWPGAGGGCKEERHSPTNRPAGAGRFHRRDDGSAGERTVDGEG